MDYKILVIAFFLMITQNFARGNALEEKRAEERRAKNFENAHFVVLGLVEKLEAQFFYDGKELKLIELKQYLQEPPKKNVSVSVRYVATVNIKKVIKGPLTKGKVTFQWEDLADSLSPIIPIEEIFKSNIEAYWYSTQPIKNGYEKTSVLTWVVGSNNTR